DPAAAGLVPPGSDAENGGRVHGSGLPFLARSPSHAPASRSIGRGPMEILCPSCAHALRFNRPEPGRFGLSCPRCSTPLKLIVPKDPDQTPVMKLRQPAAETPPLDAAEGRESTLAREAAPGPSPHHLSPPALPPRP